MNKRLLAFVPAALAAGAVLLSACGHVDGGAQAPTTTKTGQSTQTNTGTPARTDGVAAGDGGESGETVEPADCGTIEIHSVEQRLIADGTSAGRVGCTEAFNVIDVYLAADPVPAGWTCDGTDNGYQAVVCQNTDGLSFHTEER